MSKQNTIHINEVEYIRADSVRPETVEFTGEETH